MAGLIFTAKQEGSVLIVSLWILALLTLTVLAAAHSLGVETRLATYQWQETRLLRAARAAVMTCSDDLRSPAISSAPTLSQPWRGNPSLYQARALPDGIFTLQHQDGGQTLYGFEDESSRINLNTAPPDVLDRLFASAPGVSAALQDWIDADDATRPGGAEKDEYNGEGPRNGPLKTVDELLLVIGVTPEIFRQVEPLVTVQGSGRVNLNTASEQVLEMIGLTPSLAQKIVLFRLGDDGQPGTVDDGVFSDPAAAASLPGLRPEDVSSLQNAVKRNLLGAYSEALRLNLHVQLDEGAWRDFRIVMKPGAWPPKILVWREASW